MKSKVSSSYQFGIVILVVVIAGISQGLLLPLLTILLERAGVSSGANGFNAAALYIGTFLTMLVIEKPVRKFGYKRVIVFGVLAVACASALFPIWHSIAVWFALRMLVGVGDSALHYASQLWITSNSPAEKRGRNISFYGMAYGTGFSVGPLGIHLLSYGNWVPFAALGACLVIALLLLWRLPHDYPPQQEKTEGSGARYASVLRMAWFALLPAFLYGYMEASMNSNFPVYGMRTGLSVEDVALLLPAVGIGGLLLQLPLGIWSDRIGRKPVLMIAGLGGGLAFLAVPFCGDNKGALLVLLLVAGGLVGSFFSLGLAYAADIVPKPMIATANVIASIHFSLGSIAGPNLGGLAIQYASPAWMFYLLGGMFLLLFVAGLRFQGRKQQEESALIRFTN